MAKKAKNSNASAATDDVDFGNFDPDSVKVVKQLISPTLKVNPGKPVFVKVVGPMFEGRQLTEDEQPKEAKGGKETKAKRGPATILPVLCLFGGEGKSDPNNGRNCQIVANKLLVGALNEQYPDHGYVDRKFRITKSAEKKKGGQNEYYTFDIVEIE
jgi:hypothetical protein